MSANERTPAKAGRAVGVGILGELELFVEVELFAEIHLTGGPGVFDGLVDFDEIEHVDGAGLFDGTEVGRRG
ncbi:hypothetical protein [Kutzneria sp. CA-103260]|uniref:hypothetical protein n=1 Tax=Kutzneria sp. CA-103260 TaxID=2802641 RepID=UPI001BA8CE9D|nr:hypothetical protein [Kutzneria sp. CA-103260]QUQ68177.1 hypothetical protein JJ691_59200 [Kutzneria sp. CA-103260]